MAVLVPFEQISAEALSNLMADYVTRDGTDYGFVELSQAQKVQRLHSQLSKGEALIVFDELSESFDILTKEQWRQRQTF